MLSKLSNERQLKVADLQTSPVKNRAGLGDRFACLTRNILVLSCNC